MTGLGAIGQAITYLAGAYLSPFIGSGSYSVRLVIFGRGFL